MRYITYYKENNRGNGQQSEEARDIRIQECTEREDIEQADGDRPVVARLRHDNHGSNPCQEHANDIAQHACHKEVFSA